MIKVNMKRSEYDAVQRRKCEYHNLYKTLEWAAKKNFRLSYYSILNNMTQEQIAAAWLGSDHCNIEPEFEIVSHVTAAVSVANRFEVEVLDHGVWQNVYDFSCDIFSDDSVQFRRLKS
ncbi:hypothetical protein JMA_27450 [Jeotgalibacillus malaysiensis]|uniref:Uncharacterized protein n=1 Tax=Jeotgalibacillus malaysiensis TaxID=1508404 RepID=A0A0B5ATL0_9BACL|nr:hypothetical protein [Jeotgalibacillus malaysiensis]AJD92062.1 hypothetical protein JMA_27450 [Jeotgalibacillus malaysiensis]